MASYVRHTSAHLPSTRFSHRPLKFFFLMLAVLPCGNILPIPQKQSPKTKSSSFWGINTDGFGRCHRQKALIHRRFKSDAKSPKTPSRNITMSWGNIDFSRKGKPVCSVGLRPPFAPRPGDSKQNVPKIRYLCKVEDSWENKNKTLHG